MRRTLGNSSTSAIGAAFRQASHHLVRSVKPAGAVSLISAAILCTPHLAQANQVIATITGKISSGTVSSGSTKSVFGFPPGTNLTGKNFTLVYTIDDTKGCELFAPTAGGPYSFIQFSSTPCVSPKIGTPGNPVTSAVLTIGGGSVSFGNQPYSVINGSQAYRIANRVAQFSIGENYYVGNYSGSGSVYANIYFSNPPYTASYDWRSPVVYNPAPGGATGTFSYSLVQRTSAGAIVSNQSTSGTLVISNLTVSGPACPSTGAVAAAVAVGASCPPQPPDIFFNSEKITNTTQQVVVGQPIQLFAMPADDPPRLWSLNNDEPWAQVAIGNFTPSPSSGTVTPLSTSDFTNQTQTPTFYWVKPGTYIVYYNYSLSGVAGSVQATFNVEGPTNPSATVTELDAVIPVKFSAGYGLILTKRLLNPPNCGDTIPAGHPNSCRAAGVKFRPYAIRPPDYTGTFKWVQIILKDQYVGKICTVAFDGGLDNLYPYPDVIDDSTEPGGTMFTALDGPDFVFLPEQENIDWTFQATMYLMWQATNVSGAIPVPLGRVDLGFRYER